MIPYGRQEITQADIDSVVDVLKSDFLTQGPFVPRFEQLICEKVNAKYALAMNSATSALHVACLALGLGEGDSLWTTPITFVASANCGLYCDSSVDFVDIDLKTYNLCPKALAEKLVIAEEQKKLPKIVVVVHLCGQSADMEAIYKLSKQYGFKIIEDASHAIGGKYQSEYIGNCRYSDITIFSFHPVKIITTAEGGMATTNDKELAEKMALYRSHGITRDEAQMTKASEGAWYYQQIELGYNYRMTELQAALGVSQLERLDSYVAKRHELVRRYNTELANLPLILPFQHTDSYSAYHLYPILLDSSKTNQTRKSLFDYLRANHIGVNVHYIPVHLQPYYERMGFHRGQFKQAEHYYEYAISLPLFQHLTLTDQNKVINCLKEYFK